MTVKIPVHPVLSLFIRLIIFQLLKHIYNNFIWTCKLTRDDGKLVEKKGSPYFFITYIVFNNKSDDYGDNSCFVHTRERLLEFIC